MSLAPIPAAIFLFKLHVIAGGAAWLLAIFAVPVGILLFKVTHPFARNIPRECETVGLLATAILAKNPKAFGDIQHWAESDVWATVQMIVSEQLGVPIRDVTKEADFVNDLGLS